MDNNRGIQMTRNELKEQIKHRWDSTTKLRHIECNEGWDSIISKLDFDLRKLVPEYTLFQVKEKFGGLRYYTGVFPLNKFEEARQIIDNAMLESLKTCECCGDTGVLCRRRGWLKTLCKTCFSEWVMHETGEYGIKL